MRRTGNPIRELAQRVRTVAQDTVRHEGTSIERWRVSQPTPLIIEEMEGDLTLEEGDPDFTIGDGLRQHIASYGLAVDDQVLVVQSGREFHAIDAASSATPTRQRLTTGAYTVSGATPKRTLNVATATTADVANVLAALISDMGGV